MAISCLEDKLVQSVVNAILTSIYEPLFIPTSFGFRPGKNCHQALRALSNHAYHHYDGAVVEIDLKKFFNTLPHEMVLKCLEEKISDNKFLRLVNKLMKTPIIDESGVVTPNEIECP